MIDLFFRPTPANGNRFGSDASSIPGTDSSASLVDWSKSAEIIPDSFSGGSAPCLQEIWLHAIPFPGLPKLLLFPTHLTEIHLVKGITFWAHFT